MSGPPEPGSSPEPRSTRNRTFEQFYAGSAQRLLMQLYLVTGDLEEARDCLQEAFARAWLRWDGVRSELGDPYGWVYTVAYRIAVTHYRRRLAFTRALRRTPPPAPVPGPGPEVTAVRDALSTLPHGQRAALVLHYYQGLSVDEIARILGVTSSAVKSRLARGRAALAPLLTDQASHQEALP